MYVGLDDSANMGRVSWFANVGVTTSFTDMPVTGNTYVPAVSAWIRTGHLNHR